MSLGTTLCCTYVVLLKISPQRWQYGSETLARPEKSLVSKSMTYRNSLNFVTLSRPQIYAKFEFSHKSFLLLMTCLKASTFSKLFSWQLKHVLKCANISKLSTFREQQIHFSKSMMGLNQNSRKMENPSIDSSSRGKVATGWPTQTQT